MFQKLNCVTCGKVFVSPHATTDFLRWGDNWTLTTAKQVFEGAKQL